MGNRVAILLGLIIFAEAGQAAKINVESSDGKTYEVESAKFPKDFQDVTKFGPVSLEESTLSDLSKFVGSSHSVKTGDAGGAQTTSCFYDKSNQAISFSSGEFHGGSVIGAVEVVKNRKLLSSKVSCGQLDKELLVFAPNSGIWLGSGKHDVEQVLGKSGFSKKEHWIYSFGGLGTAKARCGKEESVSMSSTVEVQFANNKLTKISVSKFSESNGEDPCK